MESSRFLFLFLFSLLAAKDDTFFAPFQYKWYDALICRPPEPQIGYCDKPPSIT